VIHSANLRRCGVPDRWSPAGLVPLRRQRTRPRLRALCQHVGVEALTAPRAITDGRSGGCPPFGAIGWPVTMIISRKH
jgi:hypothetical protein